MTADEERNERLNVDGTRNAVELANALEAGHLPPHLLDRRGRPYKGLFSEDMFDEGQTLPVGLPPDEVRVRADRARARPTVPWRVYRPAIVVGHSQTGEMDKIDGPYYFFKAIQKLAPLAAGVVRRSSARSSATRTSSRSTSSPSAMDHIAHQPDLDGQAFHLTHPQVASAPARCSTRSRGPRTRRRCRCASTSA